MLIVKENLQVLYLIHTFLAPASVSRVERRHRCEKCKRSYKHLRTLRFHMKHECGGKGAQFVCSVAGCNYKSVSKTNWKQHVVTKHQKLSSELLDKGLLCF